MAKFLFIGRIIPIDGGGGGGCIVSLLIGITAIFAAMVASVDTYKYAVHNWLDLDQCSDEDPIIQQDVTEIEVSGCQSYKLTFSDPRPRPFAVTEVRGVFDRAKSIEWGQDTNNDIYVVTGFEIPYRVKGYEQKLLYNNGQSDDIFAVFLGGQYQGREDVKLYDIDRSNDGYEYTVTPSIEGHKRTRIESFKIIFR